MNTTNITPQGLKASENAIRNALTQRLTWDIRDKFLADAKRQLQEKHERVTALRKMIVVMDAAKFVVCSADSFSYNFCRAMFMSGLGYITEDEYRATLAKDLAELEQLKNAVAVFDELFPGEEK